MIQRSLLTLPEIAKKLDLRIQQVWRYVKSGRLPSEKYGPFYLVRADDFEKFKPTMRKAGRPRK